MGELIKTQRLSFCYPEEKKAALKEVDITINSGDFTVIFGKSGCGKSTLLRQLLPSVAPHGKRSGNVYYKGRPISDLSSGELVESIGFVFQEPDNGIVTDKVWHELAFGLESMGESVEEIRLRVAETAAFFGITSWIEKKTTELSGGQKQILNIASAMTQRPEVLILDEPTAMLDPIAQERLLDLLKRINEETGTSVIITEHRLNKVLPMADRVYFMEDGRISASGNAKEVTGILIESDNELTGELPVAALFANLLKEKDLPLTIKDGRALLEKKMSDSKVRIGIKSSEKSTEQVKSKPVFSCNNIYFRYEKDLPDVLKGFSLKLNAGETYCILGENGSGKSTALNILSGVDRPYLGGIKVFGKDIKKYSHVELYRGCISVLPQDPEALFSKETVMEELLETGTKEGAEKMASLCGLEEELETHPYDLSCGYKQMAALAKVLLLDPKILFLDEPAKGTDALFKNRLIRIIEDLKAKGTAVCIISHDIELAAGCADRCGLLFDGRIVSENDRTSFFSGNRFYTTALGRITEGYLKGAVTIDDLEITGV